MNWSRSFAILSDKPSQIELQVNPNTELSNLIDLYVYHFMYQM